MKKVDSNIRRVQFFVDDEVYKTAKIQLVMASGTWQSVLTDLLKGWVEDRETLKAKKRKAA